MRKEIPKGLPLPWGYGLAYFDMSRAVAVCYPMPLNVAVRAWRWVIIKLRIPGFALDIDGLMHESYRTGWKRGYLRGLQDKEQEFKNAVEKLARMQSLCGEGPAPSGIGSGNPEPEKPTGA